MLNTQYNIELSVHKQPSVFNTTYTIKCRINCLIVSSSVQSNIVYILYYITLQNNRNISSINSKKNLWILPIVKDCNISIGRKYHYGKISMHNNVWKYGGDQFLKW